jgi:tRNA pseudouridine13 synthase
MNTAFAAKKLAAWAGIPEMGVSYAGLKDRHAVTRQRFTVHLPKKVAPDLALLEAEDFRVVDSAWHARKLPRGALAGNRFVLLLREVDGERDAIETRLHAIAAQGVPNAFGVQRFGRQGDNVAHARAMFGGRRVKREQRSLFLSAARAALFNRVLDARIAAGTWNRAVDGEVWMLDGSRSVFGPEPFDDALAARLAAFDIHPTGPLWGAGDLRSAGEARAIETDALSDAESRALRAGLEAAGLKQERRALRLRPDALQWTWPEANTLQLTFALPPGTYATTVLAELGDLDTGESP